MRTSGDDVVRVPPGPRIERFTNRWFFLSNFAQAPVVMDGATYPTVEHAYQAAKTLDPARRAFVRSTPGPWTAKRRARSLDLRGDWGGVRLPLMEALVRAKFAHPRLAEALRDTCDAVLVEGNTWHDQFWGDCRCGRDTCLGPGENRLGRILEAVRFDLRRAA